MKRDQIKQALDLRREDIDPETFAAALAVRHVRQLIAKGGSAIGRPEEEDALHPQHLERLVTRAVETAQKTRHFEDEWRRLLRVLPQITAAWQRGQANFHTDLARAMGNQEEMEYLPHIDFAVDSYAEVTARKTYPHDRALENWAINGYMLAWHQHFLAEDESTR